MKYGYTIFLVFIFSCMDVTAQDTNSIAVTLQPVIITVNRKPLNAQLVNRSVDIIEGAAIQSPGAGSLDAILRSGSTISVQSRGLFGVQTDIGIRGSLFSQNLILLDGIPINDHQTAHHNFDIPISSTHISRIEVLKGPGSSQYGANAFGGTINIITQEPKETSGILRLSGGGYGLFEGSGTVTYAPSSFRTSHSFEIRRSDGYRFDTDFSIFQFSTNTYFDLPWGTYHVQGGYSQKEFGAFDFYSPGRNKPSKEWTETAYLALSTSMESSSVSIHPKIYYRSHYDRFQYDIQIPDKYINTHRTQTIGGEIIGHILSTRQLDLLAGVDANSHSITSTSLGNHAQSLYAFLLSSRWSFCENMTFDAGIRTDVHSGYGTQINPTMGIGYIFSNYGKLYCTAGRSFRAPSYTELYYFDPATKGNPDLHPETGWSYEGGADFYTGEHIRFSASVFLRHQDNLIDYVRFTPHDTQSAAINFTSAVTRGVDIDFRWQTKSANEPADNTFFFLQQLTCAYEYLDSQIDRGSVYASRYSFIHPRHRILAGIRFFTPYAIDISLNTAHHIKLNSNSYTFISADAVKQFSQIKFYVRGTNLLNQSYEEIAGVPLPGRWLWAGAELHIF